MPLANNKPLPTTMLGAYSPSVGATPVVAYMRAPERGRIKKYGCVLGGTLTGDATVTVAVNGTAVTTFTLTASGSVAGTSFTGTTTTTSILAQVNEDDVISFTSASGTGASIPGHYSLELLAN